MRGRACRAGLVFAIASVLAGCASLTGERDMADVSAFSERTLGTPARLIRSGEERQEARAGVDLLLAQPLSAEDAVRISLTYSPGLQALLHENVSASAEATQTARLANPVFTFERLVRHGPDGVDKDIGRMLAFSVFELLTLPARLESAGFRQQQLRVKGAADVMQAAAETRQAWVRAVSAQQAVLYFERVREAADASAELARRMQAAGNFSRLQRAREQAFSADAVAQLARAKLAATGAREALVRALGLDAGQAAILKLPDRLADLPGQPMDEKAVGASLVEDRLDVRMARADLAYLAKQMGLTQAGRFIDGLHVAAVRNSETGKAPQKGFEVELPLPIFDFGDARRAGAEANYRAALNRTIGVAGVASSQLRESYATYRTAYDLARHYRDEVVPLRQAIAEETLLKYNGMLISVFELLADSREQVASVIQSIEAQRDFWLADANLRASLVGKPLEGPSMEGRPAAGVRAGRH